MDPITKPVAAYCRVSTQEQKKKGHGIEIQVRDVTLFAKNRGLFIQHLYKDEAQSGVKENRKALRRLLRDCKAGRIGVVIIPSLDRLSREVRIAENLFYEFERLGVQVLITDMPNYNSRNHLDVLMRQVNEAMAEVNRKQIIDKLWKGRQARVRKGLFPGGNVPYGFRRQGKKKLVRYPAEVETVQMILELQGRGRTRSGIAESLNAQGAVRRNGKPWTRRQVSAVLERRALYETGVIRYGEANGKNKNLILMRDEANA